MSQETNPGPGILPDRRPLVYSVENVELDPIEGDSNPNTVKITAEGTVRSGGWKNPQLIPIVHVQPPEDGIWHFSFAAEAPEGPVPEVMAPIRAVYVMEDAPDEFKGVRVLAETNSVEVALR